MRAQAREIGLVEGMIAGKPKPPDIVGEAEPAVVLHGARVLTVALGCQRSAGSVLNSVHLTPWKSRNSASTSPTGPPPTIATWVVGSAINSPLTQSPRRRRRVTPRRPWAFRKYCSWRSRGRGRRPISGQARPRAWSRNSNPGDFPWCRFRGDDERCGVSRSLAETSQRRHVQTRLARRAALT